VNNVVEDTKVIETSAFANLGSDDQDLLPVLEQLEIQDLGELSLIAWRVI
jgi:hypothetical protein